MKLTLNPKIIVSIIVLLLSVVQLSIQLPEVNQDIGGGVLVEVNYDEAADFRAIRQALVSRGITRSEVTYFGSEKDVLIISPLSEKYTSQGQIEIISEAVISSDLGHANIVRTSNWGPFYSVLDYVIAGSIFIFSCFSMSLR